MAAASSRPTELEGLVEHHLGNIYHDTPDKSAGAGLAAKLLQIMRLESSAVPDRQPMNHWSERDVLMITYGDSLQEEGVRPLATLKRFLDEHCADVLSGVHILPFYPWSSDDGFSVIDYSSVNDALGDWSDIRDISSNYDLMADLVINHCSRRGPWFQNFMEGRQPGKDYFYTADPATDFSSVVRPRTTPLLNPVQTVEGEKHVWCTFSEDQVDLDFRNPEVLCEFVRIIRHYLDMGIRTFRLDAIAFLWKRPGTDCLNLPETHEIVRLLRVLIEHARADALLITETNIPNRENLSYFGNSNEAHCVYNFSLPPLLVNSLITGDCTYLKQWMMSMPPARTGTAYFNFIASHDGIGLRPTEGLLSETEITTLIDTMKSFGGEVSWRALQNGIEKPYEINISLFDALQGTTAGKDDFGLERFLCAHAIMLGLEGIPAIYLHSLLGTRNDYARVEHSGHKRAINRHQWSYPELERQLEDTHSHHARVFDRLRDLLAIRREQSAFHPNATQFTLHLGSGIFAFWRQSIERDQSIFCLSNISDQPQTVSLQDINLIDNEHWWDLVSGDTIESVYGDLVIAPYATLWITNKAR